MDGKDLKRLNRKQLLEILLAQVTRINELEEELEKKENALNSKKVTIKEAGSIAEASLKLSGIFEVAQNACDEYIKNVNVNCEKIKKQAQKEAREEKKKIIEAAEAKCRKREEKSEDYLKQLKAEIKVLEEKKKPKKNAKKSSKEKATEKKVTRKKR